MSFIYNGAKSGKTSRTLPASHHSLLVVRTILDLTTNTQCGDSISFRKRREIEDLFNKTVDGRTSKTCLTGVSSTSHRSSSALYLTSTVRGATVQACSP